MPVIDIPCGVQAFEFDCGPKSLQLVLAYYGIDVREDELLQKLKTDNNGSATWLMRRAHMAST